MKALMVCKSPFLVNLKHAFQTETALCLVLDLMTGGDLCYHLNKSPTGRFGAEQARFHAAEILHGVQHLHEHGFVYRDLKPDNVLLSENGHCKISDLGLALSKDKSLIGTAGTLGYMPPEMFRRNESGHYDPQGKKTPYDHSVDWWSFGCVVFEMLVGKCPFRTTAAKNYYELIFKRPSPGGNPLSYRYATCSMNVEYTSSVFQTPDGHKAMKLIRGCLNRDPSKRLGANELLFHKLRYHEWFTDELDMNLVGRKLIQPPFIPRSDKVNCDSAKEIVKAGQKPNAANPQPTEPLRMHNWYHVSPEAFQEEVVDLMRCHGDMKPMVSIDEEKFDFCPVM